MMLRPGRLRRQGFSLMEVLIAMMILTAGATSVIALFAVASSTHKRAVDRTRSALIAEEIFSQVQALYRFETEPQEILSRLKQTVPAKIDGYYWEVILYQPGRDSRRSRRSSRRSEPKDSAWGEEELVVRVAVKWAQAARPREEIYSTILLPRGR